MREALNVELEVSETGVLRENKGFLSVKGEKSLRGVKDQVPDTKEFLTGPRPLRRERGGRGEGCPGTLREVKREGEGVEKCPQPLIGGPWEAKGVLSC